MTTKISTDWHLGVTRTGGTTPATQVKLRDYLLASLAECLGDEDHLVCGDLFDKFTVDTSEVVKTYTLFSAWLKLSGKKLALIRGNHDYSNRDTQVCSFDLLGTILTAQFPDQVTIARDVTYWKNFVLVPHLPNNDLLDKAVSDLVSVDGKFVVFHANFNNGHCQNSDHSLNITVQQASNLVSSGATVIFGHEHVYKTALDGNVIVMGNTVPSSIADCIGNVEKFAYILDNKDMRKVKTWQREDSFVECDWQDLADLEGEHQFIRVVGHAESEQAEAVINALATARRTSTAFIISNAVQIGDMAEMDGLSEMNANEIKAFDVLAALLDELTEREQDVVRKLLEV